MEVKISDGLGLNVIQALSSSAATASTLNHPVEETQNSSLDSSSFSHSEGDGLDNVPPPPPPLGIESQFDMLHISNSKLILPNKTHDQQKDDVDYQPPQGSSRKTIFQKLHNLGLATSGSQARGNKISDKQLQLNDRDQALTEELSNQNELNSTFTSSHFATLRRICSNPQYSIFRYQCCIV